MDETDLLKPFMETFEIITQIEQFYNSAWEKLIITGGIIFAIVGILIPIYIQFLQNRTLKLQERDLEKTIKIQIEAAKKELSEYLDKIIIKQKEIFDKDIYKLNCEMQGGILHLQSNHLISINATRGEILSSLIRASLNYLECENNKHLFSMLQGISRNLHDISQDELDGLTLDNPEANINNLIALLKEKNGKGFYSHKITEIEKRYNQLPKTQKEIISPDID